MSKRVPIGINRTSLIEQQIREAQRMGEFDGLPGEGKPLPDLDEVYDPAWWARKLIQRERLSVLPPALEIRRRLERDLERLASIAHEREARKLLEELNREIGELNARTTSGPATNIAPLDVEEVLARWHARREAG